MAYPRTHSLRQSLTELEVLHMRPPELQLLSHRTGGPIDLSSSWFWGFLLDYLKCDKGAGLMLKNVKAGRATQLNAT